MPENFREVYRDCLMDQEPREVIWVTTKRFWEALNESLSWEIKNFIVEKDKDVSQKEDWSTKRILKILLTQHIKEQQANIISKHMHQHVCTTMLLYPMINFNLMKKIFSYVFMSTKIQINYFSSIFKEAKFRVLQRVIHGLVQKKIILSKVTLFVVVVYVGWKTTHEILHEVLSLSPTSYTNYFSSLADSSVLIQITKTKGNDHFLFGC